MSGTRPITFADIAHLPAPGVNAPVAVTFSSDGRIITYLFSSAGTLSRELWAYDRDSGREWRLLDPPGGDGERLTREEELRRERQRQLASGVTAYAWSETGDTLLVQAGGAVLVRRGLDGDWRTVAGAGCLDPRLSRDGARLAFVRDGELYALDLNDAAAEPVRRTFDAAPAGEYGDRPLTNGLAEFVAQEEMGRSSGYWWSPDGRRIAFEQVDNTPVPPFLITHPGTDAVEVEAHRYPFAGEANARVRLGVVPVAGGNVRWLALGDDPDVYLARVDWTPDGKVLAQVQRRDQRRVEVRRIDPDNGEVSVLWAETGEPWVNLHDDLRFVQAPGAAAADYRILWSSERSGRRRLYLYDRDGSLLHAVSGDDLLVDAVRAVDPAAGRVYVEGWSASPLERQLYRLPLAGGAAERITRRPGTHRCVISPKHDAFVDLFDAAETPPEVVVCDIDGAEGPRLQAGAKPDPRLAELELPPPELVQVSSRDGETLYGAIYPPRGLAPGTKAPVIVTVYGGPHVQTVSDSWASTVNLRAQRLAQQGFLVFKLDNRCSARRGPAFEAAGYGNMGATEVRDQVDGVRSLASRPDADLERVGVYGWSYGGYMTLMCLAKAPEVFKAGVAGAPVTTWEGYDTHYTERYMGTPQGNPDGYRTASVLTHVKHIRGALLIVHGMIDENVHFRHTGRLVQALIVAGIPHETLFFPEERHGPRREQDRAFLERKLAEFFERALR